MDEIEREYLDTKDADDIRDHNGHYSRAFVDWLKEKASRDSRTLSAVPSDSQIDVIFSEYCNLYESEDGNYSALESDDFALAVKELFKRGIAG